MTDFILKVRLGITDTPKNKKLIPLFSKWLNQGSYNELALEFVQSVLKSAQVPFDGTMTTELDHSARSDYLEDLRHPSLGKGGNWFLDDIQLKNKAVVFIKLENQWLKGKIKIEDKNTFLVFDPENVAIPLNENLFLRW